MNWLFLIQTIQPATRDNFFYMFFLVVCVIALIAAIVLIILKNRK